jgi:hypothetical protein
LSNVPFAQIGPFTGGIDNINPVRSLAPDTLREAVGIDIDNIGNAETHPGLTTEVAGAAHSLWSNQAGTISLFAKGTSLYSDISSPSVIDTIASGRPLSFDEINDEIYYSNGIVLKKTDGGSVSAVTNQDTRPFKVQMRPGNIIAFHNNRLYAAIGGMVYFSDSMSFGTMDQRFCRLPLPGNITMFKPVKDGIWLSFGGKTYFMMGSGPDDFDLGDAKLDYPALGQAVEIRRELGGLETEGNVIGWMSAKGVCFGTDGGYVVNRSSKRYRITANMRGAASLFRIKRDGIGHLISVLKN